MEQSSLQNQYDPLRNRFTAWLDKLIRRARLNYFDKEEERFGTVSLEDVPEKALTWEDRYDLRTDRRIDEFSFEEERLAVALQTLPLMRRRILFMLFIEEKQPEEIAEQLGCSVQNVYNQKWRAIKALRQKLSSD